MVTRREIRTDSCSHRTASHVLRVAADITGGPPRVGHKSLSMTARHAARDLAGALNALVERWRVGTRMFCEALVQGRSIADAVRMPDSVV
jgi:hypothetical protein